MSRSTIATLAMLIGLAVIACASAARDPAAPGPGQGLLGGAYFCHTERSAASAASMCRPSREHCEAERAAAGGQGLDTSACVQVTPVSCFQLGNDPAPAAEWCAATLDDCELWRGIDLGKNGVTGASCAWRH